MNAIDKITFTDGITQINVDNAPSDGSFICALFSSLAADGIDIDMICRPLTISSRTRLSFTVKDSELCAAISRLYKLKSEHGSIRYSASTSNTKIAVQGSSMNGSCGVAASVFNELCTAKTTILLITTGCNEISVLIPTEQQESARTALNGLCQANF